MLALASAGVERTCGIHAADLVTLKLFALSEIVKALRKQMSPLGLWSAEVQNLPDRSMAVSLDDLLQVSFQ